jgi:L-iditol 2-dehydrogenase
MKAAVYYSAGDIRVEERSDPIPEKNNLIVKVKCCSICGTDLKILTSGNPRCHPPRIIGHEMAGIIIHKGSNVEGFETGERITLATTISCGECDYCKIGLGNMCPEAKPISYDFDGAFAEYIEIPPAAIRGGNVIKIPQSVTDEAASLSEPLSCAVNSHEIVNLKKGDNVVIVGGGPLGAIHAELAKAEGAKQVIIVQRYGTRFELLKNRFKDIVLIDASKEDVQASVKEKTGGMGADTVIVCAPSKEAMEQSLNLARKGGGVNLFASLPKGASEITVDSRIIHYNELRVTGASDSRPEHVVKAIQLLNEGSIDHNAIITHKISLEKIHDGFELMKNRNSLKILVYPGEVEK